MKLFILFSLVLLSFSTLAQTVKSFLYMSYNVEQLYDNINDPIKDENFLPTSNPPYTNARMNLKIDHMAEIIMTERSGSYFGDGPDVIGLVEVENLNALNLLRDSLNSRLTKPPYYTAIFVAGDDVSGINPGILTKFPIIDYKIHKPHGKNKIWYLTNPSFHAGKPVYTVTRDILEVTTKIEDKPVTFLVNHWPAKTKSINVMRRIACGEKLRTVVSSIIKDDPSRDIVISGDFNAEAEEASLFAGLQLELNIPQIISSTEQNPLFYSANFDIYQRSRMKEEFYRTTENFVKYFKANKEWDISILENLNKYYFSITDASEIINKFVMKNSTGKFDYKYFKYMQKDLLNEIYKRRGTFYYWRGKSWNSIDTIVFGKTLFDGNNFDYKKGSFKISRPPFATFYQGQPLAFHKCKREPNKKGQGPCKPGQQNGYSDHFPVSAIFNLIL